MCSVLKRLACRRVLARVACSPDVNQGRRVLSIANTYLSLSLVSRRPRQRTETPRSRSRPTRRRRSFQLVCELGETKVSLLLREAIFKHGRASVKSYSSVYSKDNMPRLTQNEHLVSAKDSFESHERKKDCFN